MTAEAIAIADRLVSAGFERKVAEEVASVLSAAQARADADAKIAEARADYNAKIADARAEAREDNARLEGEFNTAVERLEGRLNANFAEFRAEVNERFARLESNVRIILYLMTGTFLSVFLPHLLKLIGS